MRSSRAVAWSVAWEDPLSSLFFHSQSRCHPHCHPCCHPHCHPHCHSHGHPHCHPHYLPLLPSPLPSLSDSLSIPTAIPRHPHCRLLATILFLLVATEVGRPPPPPSLLQADVTASKYTGMGQTFSTIYREQGLAGFYRGGFYRTVRTCPDGEH